MKHIKLIFALILLLGIYACPDPDDDPISGADCRLTQSSFDISGDPAHGDTYFSYNSDDQLTQIVSEEYDQDPLPYKTRVTLEYNGDKLSQVNTYSKLESSPEERNFRFKFYYDGSKLDSVKVDGYNAYAGHDYYDLIEYSGDKLSMIRQHRFNTISQAYEYNSEKKIIWNGDNVEQVEDTNNAGDTSVFDYFYDDKNKAYGGLGVFYAESDLSALSENNVKKWTLTNSNGVVILERNISYTYNDKDYPETHTLGNGFPLYQLEYNCN